MLTILEGPDGSGKSSFAQWYINQSSEDYTAIDHHGSYPEIQNTFDYYHASIIRAREHFVVMDRAWHSEVVYGPLRSNPKGDRVGLIGRRILERFALAVRGVVVLFLPPYDTCREWFLSKANTSDAFLHKHAGDNLLDVHERVYRDYYRFMTGTYRCGLPLIEIDPTDCNYEATRAAIKAVRPPQNEGPGVGAWKPGESLLVLSDGVPYMNTSPRSEAGRIAQELELAQVPEGKLYWAQPRGVCNWIDSLRPRHVFAIGKRAHRYAARWNHHVTNLPNTFLWHSKNPITPHPLAAHAARYLIV